uniref:Uncharacterized protein n=1 Tax=Salix viminalis TaxID=40686 RepID=A0A6N2N4R0_SALVM
MSLSNYLPLPSSQSNRKKGQGKNGFRRRCLSMAKQQKTRFYILGRCVSMLLCWHDHAIPASMNGSRHGRHKAKQQQQQVGRSRFFQLKEDRNPAPG